MTTTKMRARYNNVLQTLLGKSDRQPVTALEREANRVAQRIIDVQVLEPRLLLSGIGTGLGKKKVKFTDSDGDKVSVSLKSGKTAKSATFDITLDGGAQDLADIQSIILHDTDGTSALTILAQPQRVKIKGVPLPTTNDEYGIPLFISPGITEVTLVSSITSMKGIAALGAVVNNVQIGDATHVANLGSLAEDPGIAKLLASVIRSNLYSYDQIDDFVTELGKIDFGIVNVTGNLGSLVLRGLEGGHNDLLGPITVGGSFGALDARFSDVLAPVRADSLGTMQVDDILSNVTITNSVGTVQAYSLFGAITAGTEFSVLALSGAFAGTAQAGTFGNTSTDFSLSVDGYFSGLLEAGSIHGDLLINSSPVIGSNGYYQIDSLFGFTGTIHATTGNIGNVLVTQNNTGFAGHVVADVGSVGNVTAGFFYQAAVEAGTSIGLITSNLTTAGLYNVQRAISFVDAGIEASVFVANGGGIAGVKSVAEIDESDFHATGAIGNVDVLEEGIDDSVFRGGSIGNVTTTEDIFSSGFQATAGGIGNVTIRGESIVASNFEAATSIGNVSAGDTISYATFLAGTNIGNINAYYLRGDDYGAAIYYSSFTAGGAIGNIKSVAGNSGAYGVGSDDVDAIRGSFFTAGTKIGTVTAISTNTFGGGGINESTFTVTGTGLTGTVLGNVTAKALTGEGIDDSTFHAVSGNIGNVTGTSQGDDGIEGTHIIAETGNVGIVWGTSYSAYGGVGGDGLQSVTIQAGAGVGGTGMIAGIGGSSVVGDGIDQVYAYAGTGGIGYITGISSGAGVGGGPDGIHIGVFNTTGTVGDVTGLSASGDGIGGEGGYVRVFAANGIGDITGRATAASGYSGIGANTLFNADVDNDGVGAIASVTGSSAGSGPGIDQATFLAGSGIGAISGTQTAGGAGGYASSGIRYAFFSADADHDGSGAIASVTGSTNSFGHGIVVSEFLAGSGIGDVSGSATGPYGRHGIMESYFDADNDSDGSGAIGNITGKTSSTNSGFDGIYDSSFYAGSGIGNIYGSSTSDDGIGESHFDADYDRNGVGNIGSVTGKSLGDAYGYYNSGIDDSSFLAGYQIGAVYGYTNSRGNQADGEYAASGIRYSDFYANAGPSATEAGKGIITSVKGVSTSTNARASHYGIYYSYFGAGNGTDGNGYIGTIIGTAVSSTGKTDFDNYAAGIYGSTFAAGMGLGGTGNIASVTASATAVAGEDTYAYGIRNSLFNAGYLNGTLGTVTSTATAVGNGYAGSGNVGAYGIDSSYFYAGYSYGGNGTVGSISGTATATGGSSGSEVNAYGFRDSNVTAGYNAGSNTIGSIYGKGVASGLGDIFAYGVEGTTLLAGYGVGGTGSVASISGYAKATGTSLAAASGIQDSVAKIGYHDGTIGAVSGIGKAYASGSTSSTATAFGIDDSEFFAGYGLSTGKVDSVTGYAKAVVSNTVTGKATAVGIESTTVYAGAKVGGVTGDFGSGYIGQITGTGKADASGYDATAIGKGISGLKAVAADGDYSTGTIVGVTGSGTATSSAEDDATSKAYGINDSYIAAGVGFSNTGTVGDIAGNATASSTTKGDYNDVSSAFAYGIRYTPIYSGTGSASTGTVGSVTGTVSATASGGSAYVYSYGFKGPYIKVGYAGATTPYISQVVTAYAKSLYGNAKAYTGGLTGLTITAGFGPYASGTIGKGPGGNSIYGNATATALAFGPKGSTFAKATGVDNVYAYVGTGYKGTGTIYDVTGIATATAHSYGYKGSATAKAYGIADSDFNAANAYDYSAVDPKAFGGVGSIGNITGTATATAIAEKDEGNATAIAIGILNTDANAGNAEAIGYYGTGFAFGGTGTIGDVTGTGDAYALSQGFNAKSYATGTGIDNVGLDAGNADAIVTKGTATAYGGTGTIGNVLGTGTAKAYGVLVANSYAHGVDFLDADAGNAYSDGVAYGGTGTIGTVTGTATATSTASAKYSSTYALAEGVSHSYLGAGNSYGDSTAKGLPGAKSSIGDITGTGTATATGVQGKTATANAWGVYDVDVAVGTSKASVSGEATAYYGKLGNVTGTGAATAAASASFGYADTYAAGIKDFYGYAATADGGTATGGTGIIGLITGVGTAVSTGDTTNADAYGIDPSGFYAGSANVPYYGGYETSIAGAGTIGNVSGTASATATGNGATGYAAGIYSVTLSAGSAVTAAPGDTATAAAGTIGTITGKATTNVSGANSKDDVTGYGIGINNLYVYAGTATAPGTATGAAGTVGDVTAAAYVTVIGTTTGSDADVIAESIALEDSSFTVGSAVGGYGAGYTATAGKGTFGNVNVKATTTLTGTTAGSDAQVSGSVLGVSDVDILVSNASGYTAVGADGTVGTIMGTVNATIVGTTSGDGDGDDDVDVVADTVRVTNELYVEVSNAHGSYAAGGSATAGDGTVGAVSGTSSATLTGTTSGDYGHVRMNMEGIENTYFRVSNAYGYDATGGDGSVGSITGNTTSTTTGTTSGDDADVFNDETRGIDDTYVVVSNAYGSYSAGGSATAGNGTAGALTGTATSSVTGTTTGADSGVWNNETVGIEDGNIYVSNARGYVATGGTGSVGGQVGTASATVTGTTSKDYSDVYTKEIRGLYETVIEVSNAYGSYSAGGSATAGNGTVGALTGTATATVTGITTGKESDVYASETYGIYVYSDDNSADIYVSNARGYVAQGGAAVFSPITGSATVSVTGTTGGKYADVYARDTFGIDADSSSTIRAGNANGSYSAKGVATAGAVTFGDITGTANVTVNGTTTGYGADVYAQETDGIDPVFSAGNAYGFAATGGAVTFGKITGSATVDVTGTTGDDYADVFADDTYGIDSVTITAGVAVGYAGKGGSATGGDVTIGNVDGSAKVTVTGTTAGLDADVYSADVTGLDVLSLTLGTATGYTATAGDTTLGTITGYGSATVTGTTTGDYSDVFADVYGIQSAGIAAGNATGSGAKGGVATAGALTTGAITGTAKATVVGTTSGDYLTVNADDVYGISYDSTFAISAGNAVGYKAYGGKVDVGAVTGTATGSATGTTNGGKGIDVSANYVYGIYSLTFSLGAATSGGVKGVATSGVVTTGAINGTGTASATNTSTYAGGGSTVSTDAYGAADVSITASSAIGYYATSGNSTLGAVTGKGTATSSGTYGKQAVDAYAIGVRNLYQNASYVLGTKVTAGTGSIGATSGTGTATATGYYATANSKGIDPSYLYAGNGTYGKGTIGAVSGTGTATAKGVAAAYASAYGVDSLTLSAGNGYKGTGTITSITGSGDAYAYASGVGPDYASGFGLDNVYASAGIGGGTGSIGAISGTGKGDDGPAGATDFAYGIDSSVFYSSGGIGAITGSGTAVNGYADNGIVSSLFSAKGNITSLTVTGNVGSSRFLAGFGIGANLAVDAGDAAVAGASIGAVSVSGSFVSSDLIASVDDGGDAAWGQANDVDAGGGTIGAVTIGVPTSADFIADGAAGNAIEADAIASFNLGGGAAEALPGVIDNDLSGTITAGDVRVRLV